MPVGGRSSGWTIINGTRLSTQRAVASLQRGARRRSHGSRHHRAGHGQGFVGSSTRRRLIEDHAMRVAKNHYVDLGWSVEDVSRTRSFDLLCTRGPEILHVEVKGTTSPGWDVLLTPNEVAHARTIYPHVALAVVSNIHIRDDEDFTGGALSVFDPWAIDEGRLTAIGFSYRTPSH